MLVRLPSAAQYVSQVEKEQRWLPVLAKIVSLPIPKPIALGKPGADYPWPWSVYGWLDGETILENCPDHLNAIAYDLADFLNSLEQANTKGAPVAGSNTHYRGCSLIHYEDDVHNALTILKDDTDIAAIYEVWQQAIAEEWHDLPVWFHGDVSLGNLLVRSDKLSAVIDFGLSAVGDPACDLAIAWTLFNGESRRIFRQKRNTDTHTWNRGRGWALWKALIIWSGIDPNQRDRDKVEHIVREILTDR